jgi:hypothetical protein
MSASQIRALGVLDSLISLVPLLLGLTMLVASIAIPSRLPLSNYQLNTLAVLIITGGAEFLLTIWIRFVVNRRTLGIGSIS